MAFRTSAFLITLVLSTSTQAVPAQDTGSPDPERLLFLLEYIGVDYGAAVQGGTIANAFEYQEMVTFSGLLINRFDILRDHGAAEEVRIGLLRLQGLIHGLAPWNEIRALTGRLTSTLFDQLEVVSSPVTTPDLRRGELLYADNCAACHGPAGAGDGFGDPEMDPPATSFLDERMNLLSPHQVYGAINFGIDGTAMPSYVDALPPQQLWDIAFHVMTLRERGGDSVTTEPGDPLEVAIRLQDAFASVADKVLPSVVNVTSFVRTQADAKVPDEPWEVAGAEERMYPGFRRLKSGSGFFVTDDGYLLTGHHVVTLDDGETAEVLDVELPNGRHVLSRLVGAEPTINLAVLKLEVVSEHRPPRLTPVTIGDSDAVRVGHWTIAVGDPWGPPRTYAVGTLAAQPQRQCYQEDLTGTLMQASLTVHPEAYGGPLVDIRGRVVGMTVPAARDELLPHAAELALPINLAINIYKALKLTESRRSPWLGFSVLELAAVTRRGADPAPSVNLPRTGVYIDDLFDPSPASSAGIRVGDSLVAVDGHRLFSVLDFQKWLYLSGIGRTIELEIYRDGKTLKKKVAVEERPASATPR
jgi:S1-C subfamily serine protease